jgi:hypothetical protein
MNLDSPFTRSPGRERSRQLLVRLLFLIYLLLLFEGGLRKWLLPAYSQALFFVRDPVVLLVYLLALKDGWWPKRSPLVAGAIALGAAGLLVAIAQLATAGGEASQRLMFAAYGWRNYFFYIPLAAVIGEVLEPRDLRLVIRTTLWLVLPVAVLVFIQFRSASDAPINVGSGATEALQFRGLGLDEEHTRPMGIFTSDVGQKLFTVSCVAMLLAQWISPRERRFVPPWQLIPATAATLTCLAVGGSRGAMLQSAIVVAGALAASVLVRRGGISMRAVLLPTLLAVAAVALYPIVFPEGYAAFMTRWTLAADVESQSFKYGIFSRALYALFDFVFLIGDAPVAGYGLGLAGNAALTLGADVTGFHGWAETDWSRHIVDLGPVLGLIIIAARIALTLWLGRTCLTGARRAGDPLPLLLFAFIGEDLLSDQITGHGTVNGYSWIFAGYCLAAARLRSAEEEGTAGEPARPVAVRRFPNIVT